MRARIAIDDVVTAVGDARQEAPRQLVFALRSRFEIRDALAQANSMPLVIQVSNAGPRSLVLPQYPVEAYPHRAGTTRRDGVATAFGKKISSV